MRDRPIDEFMTRSPYCIDAGQRISDAYRLMREKNCRHLPVLKDGKIVGIVSERGLYRLATLIDLDRATNPVSDAMDPAYAVLPGTPLLQVAAEMAGRKTGAAVVAKEGRVLGIFTTNDALDALVLLDSALLSRAAERRTLAAERSKLEDESSCEAAMGSPAPG